MKHIVFWVVLLLFLSTVSALGQIEDSTLIMVEKYARKVQSDWKIPGISLSIVKDDSLVFAKGFGVREKGHSATVTENTVFHIGSVSKSFTAAVMASLVDEGLLSWDDAIKDIMSDFNWWDNNVEKTLKVKELFTHGTGLVAQVGTYIPNLGYGREDVYKMIKYMQPWFNVGDKFAYNNITFIVAARIIEKLTGKSWEENVQERILTPLGMTASSLGGEGYLAAGNKAAVAHSFRYVPTGNGNGKMAVSPLYGESRALHWVSVIGPAGGVISTAEDMSKWVRFHLDMGKVALPNNNSESTVSPGNEDEHCDSIQVISKENMEFLHTGTMFVKKNDTYVRHYGYCWYVEDNDRYHLIYHTGTTWGFTAICGFVPDLKLGFALLCNSEVSEYARFSIMRRIIDLYLLKRDREQYVADLALQDSLQLANSSQSKITSDNEGYTSAMLTLIAQMFPEDSTAIMLASKSNQPDDNHLSITDSMDIAPVNYPPELQYRSLYDWSAHYIPVWFANKKKPSRRSVPCTIKRSTISPNFTSLIGTYRKEAPFGDAVVSLENEKLFLTIGPKRWKHQLKHKIGNEFWFYSGGHTYPIFFHSEPGQPVDFEIDFNYNENFGPWKKL